MFIYPGSYKVLDLLLRWDRESMGVEKRKGGEKRWEKEKGEGMIDRDRNRLYENNMHLSPWEIQQATSGDF